MSASRQPFRHNRRPLLGRLPPKAMGGPGKAGATTPEDLFAAGYAACFGSACEFMGAQLKLKPTSVTIQAAVGIGTKTEGGFGLKVDLIATLGGLSQADAEKVFAAGWIRNHPQ